MYLHIGNGNNVRLRDVIGIFDLDNATVSAVTRASLRLLEKEKCVEYGDRDIPRAFLLTQDAEKRQRIVLSHISSAGLRARAESPFYEAEEK